MPVRVGTLAGSTATGGACCTRRAWRSGTGFEYYASRYGTVENNGTFYRLPAGHPFAAWRAKTPDGLS
jgi:uncharacterized protein YecE (DUF72 family)